MTSFSLHWEVAQCKLHHLRSGLGDRLAAAVVSLSLSLSSHLELLFQSPLLSAFTPCSDAHHGLPLAMAICSATVLMGTPLRITLTWMKSVAGDRLEPSAFNK